jgi:hypothetical protein
MSSNDLKLLTDICLSAEYKSAGVEILWDILVAYSVAEPVAVENIKSCGESEDGWVIRQIRSNYKRRKHIK